MRTLLALAIAAAASPALADATVPESAPAQNRSWMLDDELVTHGPPQKSARAEPAAEAPPPSSRTSTSTSRGRGAASFEDGKCVERDTSGPDHPLDFVDSTLESGDLAARFKSSRPVVKQAPAPRRTKVLREK